MLLRLPLPLLLPLLLRLLVHGNSRAAFVCDTWLKAQASKEYSMEVSAPGIDTTGFKPTLLANAGVCVSLTLSLSLSLSLSLPPIPSHPANICDRKMKRFMLCKMHEVRYNSIGHG